MGGLGQPLTMHRKILADASERLKQLLLPLRGTGEQRLTWPFDTSSEVDRMVLVKALRFCYGETMSVGVMNGECCAMIATLKRLQVQGLDSVVSILCKFANEESKKNVEVGVELLKACSRYIECCDENGEALNKNVGQNCADKRKPFPTLSTCCGKVPHDVATRVFVSHRIWRITHSVQRVSSQNAVYEGTLERDEHG